MEYEFKIGDSVIVAGKSMQIEAINGEKANCVWFDNIGGLKKGEFPIQMLTKSWI